MKREKELRIHVGGQQLIYPRVTEIAPFATEPADKTEETSQALNILQVIYRRIH